MPQISVAYLNHGEVCVKEYSEVKQVRNDEE